jgi:hypothetical protein
LFFLKKSLKIMHNFKEDISETIGKPEHEHKSVGRIICPFVILVIGDIIQFCPE